MRKLSLFAVLVVVLGIVAGCSGGVTESAAVDKATEIENQTKAAGDGQEQRQ